jgi:DNA-binding transcriptional MerR regulator
MAKGPEAFRTISEASLEVGVAQHVLRFWETKFSFVRPMKRTGGRRFYRPRDIETLATVRRLLHDEGRSIKEVRALYREPGFKTLAAVPTDHLQKATAPSDFGGLEAALAGLGAAKSRLEAVLTAR